MINYLFDIAPITYNLQRTNRKTPEVVRKCRIQVTYALLLTLHESLTRMSSTRAPDITSSRTISRLLHCTACDSSVLPRPSCVQQIRRLTVQRHNDRKVVKALLSQFKMKLTRFVLCNHIPLTDCEASIEHIAALSISLFPTYILNQMIMRISPTPIR